MSATRTWMLARLTGALIPQKRAVEELDAYRDEVRAETAQELDALQARVADLETEPLAWAYKLDAKSLDNFLVSLGALAEHEPQDEAIDLIHELLRSFRDSVAREREPEVDGAGRTYAEYHAPARQHDDNHDRCLPRRDAENGDAAPLDRTVMAQ